MYKITKGDIEAYANTYEKAKCIYNRMCKTLYPCRAITRLYCNLGDGYCLMRCGGERIEQALKQY